MTRPPRDPIPAQAVAAGDVYKDGRLAAHLWRVGESVGFAYNPAYLDTHGPPVAFTVPRSPVVLETTRMRLPPFFAGLLPEGETRRRDIQRAFHLAEDDELGLLLVLGADTIGDVRVVPAGTALPSDDTPDPPPWSELSFRELWRQLPGPRSQSAIPGAQPKMSAHSRSLITTTAEAVLLKFALPGWRGVLRNEQFFMRLASEAGLEAAAVAVVADRDGEEALEVARFDRTIRGGTVRRHAQEDATQVLGLRPGEKYDPDARTVIQALASRCASPKLAARDLFHQLAYSYAIGNNDLHAKNLSIRTDPDTGLWRVSPVYDVLHTWPYEGDHRFVPAVRPDGPHDSVSRKHWVTLAHDLGLPEPLTNRILEQVSDTVVGAPSTAEHRTDLSHDQLRDLRRVVRKRSRDLVAG